MTKISRNSGFTLVELMVTIVIIGILIAVSLPNFMGATDRAKIASLKANMRVVENIVMIYSVDWGGVIPTKLSNKFRKEAEAHPSFTNKTEYWKDVTNPFTSEIGKNKSYRNKRVLARHTRSSNPAVLANSAGMVIYDMQTGEVSEGTQYAIYGSDAKRHLIRDKGKVFVLTNS